MTVKAKFRRFKTAKVDGGRYEEVDGKKVWKQGTVDAISLSPVMGVKEGEDSIFGAATPAGQIEMTIVNPAAAAAFVQGKRYYVTFEEAPEES